MIRKNRAGAAVLRLATALALALSGVAAASASATTPPGAVRGTASDMVVGAPECGGAHFTKFMLPHTSTGFGCLHNSLDMFDSHALSYARAKGLAPATAPVKCYGDGTTGPRIQMMYAYYEGLPNRLAAVTAQFRSQIAPRMQAVINGQGLGKDLGLRFLFNKGCKGIAINAIKVPRDIQYNDDNPGDPYHQMTRMSKYLAAKGYTRSDRKYQLLFDGWNVGACGIGETPEINIEGTQVSSLPVSATAEGLPTVGGHTDLGSSLPVRTAQYSMVWNHAGGPHGGTCFNTQGISTVTPFLHELFHTLGAVQYDAPHANATGHCDDAPSVMCPGQGPGYGAGINNPYCAKVVVETLDCGMDDYWNPNPGATNYLATHHNIAKSQFFGAQPQDNLAASPI